MKHRKQQHPETRGEFIRGVWIDFPVGTRKYGDSKFQKVYQKINHCPECGSKLFKCQSSQFFRCHDCGYGFSIAKFKLVARSMVL